MPNISTKQEQQTAETRRNAEERRGGKIMGRIANTGFEISERKNLRSLAKLLCIVVRMTTDEGKIMEAFVSLRACIRTMNRPGLLPLLHRRRGSGRGGHFPLSAARFMESKIMRRIANLRFESSN